MSGCALMSMVQSIRSSAKPSTECRQSRGLLSRPDLGQSPPQIVVSGMIVDGSGGAIGGCDDCYVGPDATYLARVPPVQITSSSGWAWIASKEGIGSA